MENSRLLIVDDSVNLTRLYMQELEDDGYCVDIADSIENAIKLICKKIYDLIIIETILKGVKNIDLLQFKYNDNREIPIIINTAASLSENESSEWSINADACIMKSSDVTILKEKIKILLDNSGGDNRITDVHQSEKAQRDKSYKNKYKKKPCESIMYLQ